MDFRATRDLLEAAESAALTDYAEEGRPRAAPLARVEFAAHAAPVSAYSDPSRGRADDADAACVVRELAVTRSTLEMAVLVRSHDPAEANHDPCASKLLVVGGAAPSACARHVFGARCGVRDEARAPSSRPGAPGDLACTLVFVRPARVRGGEEVLFEFGANGFSVVSLGRLPPLP